LSHATPALQVTIESNAAHPLISAFTELADVASFALTSRHFASAIKNAEHILGPALAAKYAPTMLALHPMLADPKTSLFVYFKRHMRAKAASTAPQPARAPRSSLADYYFSYELCAEAGRTKVAWAGQAHFTESGGHQHQAVVEMPRRGTVVERIFEVAEDCRACMKGERRREQRKTKGGSEEDERGNRERRSEEEEGR
jgi:hypothetical protein